MTDILDGLPIQEAVERDNSVVKDSLISELEDKVAELEKRATIKYVDELSTEKYELEKKLTRITRQLEKYATHRGDCDIIYNNDVSLDCSCGYSELVEEEWVTYICPVCKESKSVRDAERFNMTCTECGSTARLEYWYLKERYVREKKADGT